MSHSVSFTDLHRYIIEAVILMSLVIGAVGLILYELHGLILLLRRLGNTPQEHRRRGRV